MAFQTYIPMKRRPSDKAFVRITKGGILQLSPIVIDSHFSKIDIVQLLFDPESRRIAIKPLHQPEESALKLRKPQRAAGAHISARGFLEHFKIAVPENSQMIEEPTWDEGLQALLVQVD